ncbi:hypothetical protein MTO96_036418 [Rhipicephalus appendiculatus]
MCLDMSEAYTAHTLMDVLIWIVKGSCVRTLILSGSTINRPQSVALAKALARSKLAELHLDECRIECAAVEYFAKSIAAYSPYDNFKELNVGAVVGNDEQQHRMLWHIAEAGVRSKITLACSGCHFQNCNDWNIRAEHKHFTKVSLSFTEEAKVEPVLHDLVNATETLESLSIVSNGDLTETGATYVADLIRKCSKLRVLRLRCRLSASGAALVLTALEDSRSVVLLTMYQGARPAEIAECDPEILLSLQRNEMALAWATSRILNEHNMSAEGSVLADLLDVCDARFDLYQRVADFSPRTAHNRVRMALMATRTAYYALRARFPEPVAPDLVADTQRGLTALRSPNEALRHRQA